MTIALTAGLGEFVANLRASDIPDEALGFIRMGFTDCVGVMIAGAAEPAPQKVKAFLAPDGGEATLCFGQGRASALDAAMINATAAHALDFDDVALRGHPSAVLVPAILAEAEAIGATGEQMVRAYAAGYETWAELARRDQDHQTNKGWHPTGVFGAIGAAAACASLRGLDAGLATQAIALGASQSSGLVSNFGTMTKPFHAGRSAHAGVMAARLAETGFTASHDALEHPRGFLAAVSPAGRFDVDSSIEAGRLWKLPRERLSVKKYPLCYCTHTSLDGILDLLHAKAVQPEDVKRVKVNVRQRFADTLRNASPRTALEAKFSMQFAMACALIARRAGLAELTDTFVLRPDVQALMKHVVVVPDDRETRPTPQSPVYDHVAIETRDGNVANSGPIAKVRGGFDAPLGREELWAKFDSCLEAGGARVAHDKLFDALMSLDRLPHVRELPGLGAH